MNKLIRYSALAAFIGTSVSGVAHADTASTTGGLKIKSDDGKFDASIGGRIHFDGVVLSPDDSAYNGSSNKYGSGALNNASGFYFRRAFLTLGGHAYGWEYKVEDDLVGGQAGAAPTYTSTSTTTCDTSVPPKCTSTTTTTSSNNSVGGFQDIYIGHSLFTGSDELYLGQKKPWRSMSELQSNNEILFMERPVTSASGIFAGRDFQDGISYRINDKGTGLWAGAAFYSLSKIGQNSTEGTGENVRVAWAPINKDGLLTHIGFSYSSDHADNNNSLKPSYNFGGYKLSTPASITMASYSNSGNGTNAQADTWTGELAGIWGPAFLEGEYAHQTIDGGGKIGSDLDAYYVQASFFLTGESKGYNSTNGVVAGNPKPLHTYGAVEFKVRYEDMKNKSVNASNPATGGCTATNPGTGTIDKCDVNDVAFGINYYVNPNVRFMFDYVMAEANLGSAGKDKPDTIAARAQISF